MQHAGYIYVTYTEETRIWSVNDMYNVAHLVDNGKIHHAMNIKRLFWDLSQSCVKSTSLMYIIG